MADNLLKIRNLSVNIGDKAILRDINISQCEIHILMGPNGAGKSTLGYTVMGNPDYFVSAGENHF